MSGGFCPSCGAAAASEARFCAACGKALPRAPADVPAPAEAGPAAPRTSAGEAPRQAAEETVFELKPLVVRTFLECLSCVLTLGIAWIVLWIARLGRRHVVTTRGIESYTGVVTRRRESLEFFRVEDFEVVEPFFLRMRGAGDITIWSMDKDDPVVTLEAIPDVQTVYDKLRELTRDERRRQRVHVVEAD